MKRTPDPLLEAVLEAGPAADAARAALLAGARRRRRTLTMRRASAALALPALCGLAAWLAVRPAAEVAPETPRPYTLVRSAVLPAESLVASTVGAVRLVRTRGDDVIQVTTADVPASFDLAADDAALLALLPGGAGLVGAPGERTLFWTGAAGAGPVE